MSCLMSTIINLHIDWRCGIKRCNIWLLRTPLALEQVFAVYREELKMFKYLGRLLAYEAIDVQTIWVNLKKA